MSDRLSKLERLKALSQKRNGNKKKTYDEDIYEEVEEEDYQALNQDDDFVEDDDQGGYIDNGEVEEEQFSDEYETPAKKSKRKRKGKEKEREEPVKEKQQIKTFFNNSTQKALERKPVKKVKDEESDAFMKDLLDNFDASVTKPVTKKSNLVHKKPVFKQNVVSSSTLQSLGDINQKTENHIKLEDTQPDTQMDEFDDFDDDAADLEEMARKAENLMLKDKAPLVKKKKLEPFHVYKKAEPRLDLQNWEAAEAKFIGSTDDVVKEDIKMDTEIVQEESSTIRMWWYDAYEMRDKGTVYLFGKVAEANTNRYVSCCIIIHNIQRNLYFLPRQYELDGNGDATDQTVTMESVEEEVNSFCSTKKIKNATFKHVSRKYAFELENIPAESQYVKLSYPYNMPVFNENDMGKTFSHVFGANTSPLEQFLIKRKIKGPCWLDITDARPNNTQTTWCKKELVLDSPKLVNPATEQGKEMPPLVVMSLCLRTILNPEKNKNEIVAASALVCHQVQIDQPTPIDDQQKSRFTVVRKLQFPLPPGLDDLIEKERKATGFSVKIETRESSLLNLLLAKIQSIDPDIIVGHNFVGFDLDILLHRMKELKIMNWSRLGRLKRSVWPKLQSGAGGSGESTYEERMIMSGRLACDTYLTSKDLIRSKSYRMTDLAQSQLKIAREDIEFGKTAEYFEESESLVHLLKHCNFDAYLALALMFKLQVLPLTKQLTNIAGNLWSRTMSGARSERNEYLLLHEFHQEKYICPDKSFGPKKNKSVAVIEAIEQEQDDDAVAIVNTTPKKASSRRKPAYAGGLVLEPKKGFYDKYVVLLDFNSLYPSIIQEYNVCFTTVNRASFEEGVEESGEEKVPELPDASLAQGILPRLIKTLVDRRKQVKSLMKSPKITENEEMQLDIRQKALKLTANSMYGCLGFSFSRFFAKPLAMLITHKGREILQNTVDLAANLDLNVIYGDTDSIMVHTNVDDLAQVKKMGNLLREAVNKRYRLLEIGIDGFFKHMLLLKKKKYAARLIEEKPNGELVETIETKGLDLVRRDWCDLSHDVSSTVLELILSEKDREEVVDEIHQYLEKVGEQIRNNEVPLEKYVINKQLTKKPSEYADAKSQPHVQVAIRLLEAGHSVKSGDTVPYVICKSNDETSGDSKGSALRAHHPDEVIEKGLQLDLEWYLAQQVHPPITRLCSPIEGTDPSRLAGCLGLDTSRYNFGRRHEEETGGFYTMDSNLSDEEKYKNAERLTLKCPTCEATTEYDGIVREVDEQVECNFDCSSCKNRIHPASLQTQLVSSIREFIQRYYLGWMVCDDPTCTNRTRSSSVIEGRCMKVGCPGKMNKEYSDKELYTQLKFFSSIFNIKKAKSKYEGTMQSTSVERILNQHMVVLDTLSKIVDGYLEQSSYQYVDLPNLLAQCYIQKTRY